MPEAKIIVGDCIDVLAEMAPDSVDTIVTDPPYGLSFMNKSWDSQVPGIEYWEKMLRVAKPGAYLLAFGGTRTFHRMMVAIEDAGWEIRDTIMWVYGSGFPKSHNVGLSIDKHMGHPNRGKAIPTASTYQASDVERENKLTSNSVPDYTAKTEEGAQWNGWGTALKPAWEPIIVARKPLIGTVAENVLKYGTGAMNIDGGRIYKPGGRWPANLIHDGSEEVIALFPQSKTGGPAKQRSSEDAFWTGKKPRANNPETYNGGDSGSAARFFYCSKASKADREEGLDGFPVYSAGERTSRKDGSAGLNGPGAGPGRYSEARNIHPTVKPTDLMCYLVRLVCRPGGLVLDPFAGSGSTGKAAVMEGMDFIGIELERQYADIAMARISAIIH